MTKLHPEIKEALYDPETVQKAKDVLKYAVDKLFDPYPTRHDDKGNAYIWLQSVGYHYAIPVKELKVGSIVVYNWGKTAEVIDIKPTKGKALSITLKSKGLFKNDAPVTVKKQPTTLIAVENKSLPDHIRVFDSYGKVEHGDMLLKEVKSKGDKKKMTRLAKHLQKEHPSTKGKMTVFDIKSDIKKASKEGINLIKDFFTLDYDADGYRNPPHNPNTRAGAAREQIYYKLTWVKYLNDLKEWYAYINTLDWSKNRHTISSKKGIDRYYSKHIKDIEEYIENEFPIKEKQRTHDPKPVKSYSVKYPCGKSCRIPQTWYNAMVTGIKKSSDVRNPYAIVKNIWAKLSSQVRQDITQRAAKGERFNYNLPLPDDRVTKGQGTLRMVGPFKLVEGQVNISKKDMAAVKKSGLFKSMKREDGSICQVARCKSEKGNVNIFADEIT